MESYYVVPLYSDFVFINGENLNEVYQVKCPLLYEVDKVLNKRYENCQIDDEYKLLEFARNELYSVFDIPKYMIIVEKDGEFFEFITNKKIEITSLGRLETHMVNECILSEYFLEDNYYKKINTLKSFFNDEYTHNLK